MTADDWVLYVYGRKTDRQRVGVFSREGIGNMGPEMDFVIPRWLGRRMGWKVGLYIQVEWSPSSRMYRLRRRGLSDTTLGVKLGPTNSGRDLRCVCRQSITDFELYSGQHVWYPRFSIDGDALCLSMTEECEERKAFVDDWRPNLPTDWRRWLSPDSKTKGAVRISYGQTGPRGGGNRQLWLKKSTVQELGWQEVEHVRVARAGSYLYVEPAEAGYKLSRGNNGSRCATCSRALNDILKGMANLPAAWNAAYSVNGAVLIVAIEPPVPERSAEMKAPWPDRRKRRDEWEAPEAENECGASYAPETLERHPNPTPAPEGP